MEKQIEAALKIMCLIHEENALILTMLLKPRDRSRVIRSYADKYNAIVDEYLKGGDAWDGK